MFLLLCCDTAVIICIMEQMAVLRILDRSDLYADQVEEHLYSTCNRKLIESVPDPDY